MRPTVTLRSSGNVKVQALTDSLADLTDKQVLVGIPASNADRMPGIIKMLVKSAKSKGGKRTSKRTSKLQQAALSMINNAELMYIHTNGSPLKRIPARPVIEPSITEPANQELIVAQLRLAAEAALTGRQDRVILYLGRAGQLAENFARKWFTDPRNHWAPNAPGTIRRKGSDRPLIDVGEMRKAITHLVVEAK